MMNINEPQFREYYGKSEVERLYKRMDRIKEIERRMGHYDNSAGGDSTFRDWFTINDIEYLLAEVKRLREAIKKAYDLDGYMFLKEALGEEGNHETTNHD